MKKTTFLFTLLFFFNSINGQVISDYSIGFTSLEGIAINSKNEVYVSEHDSGKIFKLDSSGNKTLIATAGGYANDMVFDSNNNLYFLEPFTGKISVINNTTGNISLYKSIFSISDSPYGIVFYNGNLYFSSEINSNVIKINSDLSTSVYATGFFTAEGIAFDSTGNLYVADRNEAALIKITPTGIKTTIASRVFGIRGVAVSASNEVYFTKYNSFPVENKIMRYNPVTGIISDFVTTGLNQPRSIEIDRIGNMYVTNIGSGKVVKISDPSLSTNEVTILDFNISPNPVSSEINIQSKNKITNITVYNSLGQKLIESETSPINIEKVPAGVYILKVLGENNLSSIKKIIKN